MLANPCGQAVNAHGEGPLSDIVVGQTTESGEQSQNDQICRIKMRIIEIVKCTDNNMNREKLALHCIEAYKMQYI